MFFEHRGLLAGRAARRTHDAGASSFLYPFLAEREHELEPVVDDVRRSVLMKAEEIGALREQTLTENRETLVDAAATLRRSFRPAASCWRSATAARPPTRWTSSRTSARRRGPGPPGARPDRGSRDPDRDRQRHRHRRDLLAPGDRLRAPGRRAARAVDLGQLAQRDRGARAGAARRPAARSRWSATTADGWRREELADHVVVTRSEHIPRIQEAQASAYHVLGELVELVGSVAAGPDR